MPKTFNADEIVNLIQKDEKLLYRAIQRLHDDKKWNDDDKKFMTSVYGYLQVRDKLSEKQINVAKKIVTKYGDVLVTYHVEKLEKKKEEN